VSYCIATAENHQESTVVLQRLLLAYEGKTKMDEQESRKQESSEPTVPALPTTDEVERILNLAKQGNADAQNRLGLIYYNGEGVAKNYEEAAYWFRQAAEKGHASAQVDLGNMYCDGLGVTQDYVQAVSCFKKAAEQGFPMAQNDLGTMYRDGLGVAQNYEEALKWLRKAAELGEPLAQYNLGSMYENGDGVAKDYEEAIKWYRKAAEQGLPIAQNNLGAMYYNGTGIAHDYVQAVSWFKKAAEQGFPMAQYNLGWMYDRGYGVAQDYTEAIKWYRKAADQNCGTAQLILGEMYWWGRGVVQDADEALKWFRLAAENGEAEAETAIARIEANKNLKEYSRNAKSAYYDPIRGILILKTPEETVRQEFLYMLQNKYQVPLDAIEVEYPLSKHTGESRKRADIIIFSDQKPIMVIECKDSYTPLLDDVFKQCRHYADHLGCKLLAITNGDYTKAYHNLNNDWREMEAFPSFNQMLQPYKIKYMPNEDRGIEPLTYDQICDTRFLCRFNDKLWEDNNFAILGVDTPEDLWPHIANLFNAVFTSNKIRSQFPCKYQDINIAEFIGYKYTQYGNAAGGQYPGLYAGFRIVDSDRNDQIYRIGFFATGHHENNPIYGNRKGTSGIYVAIDNFDMSPHFSLELSFDTYMHVTGNSFSVNHNGRITVGKLGAAKRDLMINYVKKYAPYLIGNDEHVHLGLFQTGKLLGFDDVKDFLFRLIKYAEIRDKFRAEYKAAKKNGTAMRS
jgi:TPR repeat protein